MGDSGMPPSAHDRSPRPLSREEALRRFRQPSRGMLTVTAVWVAIVAALGFSMLRGDSRRARAAAPTAQLPSRSVVPPAGDGFRSLVGNVWPDQPLFLKADKSFIGTTIAVEDEHLFEDGTRRAAVRVRFRDGSTMWVPRQTAQRLYVTR